MRIHYTDVLVIGDSFSMPHIWQVALIRDGLKVRTEHWDNLRAVCADHGITQKFIKPHCPWQNGKVERFNRTLQTEWAYR